MGDLLDTAIARTRGEYNVDSKRITLTGLSMGGYGAWIWGPTHTDLFAALMPICGGGNTFDIEHLLGRKQHSDYGSLDERVKKLATLPIWAFHGTDDDVVPVERSREMVALVEKAGGKVKLTEFPNVGHNSWDHAYAEKKAIEWLLAQHK
jgi:predicted peptidase